MSRSDRTIVLTASGIAAFRHHPLSRLENLVLWYFIETIPPAGDVISHKGLEEKLSATHLGVVMKRLAEIGFIIRGVRVGISYHYKLNPAFFRIIS